MGILGDIITGFIDAVCVILIAIVDAVTWVLKMLWELVTLLCKVFIVWPVTLILKGFGSHSSGSFSDRD